MFDWLIRGGTVYDGDGGPGRRTDIGIRGDRIALVGDARDDAIRTIDAGGLAVAPGFIDIHTHYDAQLLWDPTASPSPLHGVTSIVGGNCGFSIAPLTADSGDYLMRMLARVEGMPLDTLSAGSDWAWGSFAEWLGRLEGRILVNAGFLVGHSTLRRAAMGERAVGGRASDEDIAAMRRLLSDSLAGGGLGFSSSQSPTHHDGAGDAVPSRCADHEEILALCRTVRDHPGTTLEEIPTVGPFSDEHVDLMTEMSLAANRPLNWNVLVVTSLMRPYHEGQLEVSDRAARRGATVLALTPSQVMTQRLNFRSGMVLDALPGWSKVFGLPVAERIEALRTREVRDRLAAGAVSDGAGVLRALAQWDNATICETFEAHNAELAGRCVGEIARDRGVDPFDLLLDVSISEGLRTTFMPRAFGDDDESWRLRAEVWTDPRTVIGASDAGAHLDMVDTFTYTTSLLGPAVRDRGLISLAEAVRQLTSVPADVYGLRDRGRVRQGALADLVVFDPERVGPGAVHTRADLPAGESRLYAEAEGIQHVFVNGTPAVSEGAFASARPGRILRSGRDTRTVSLGDVGLEV